MFRGVADGEDKAHFPVSCGKLSETPSLFFNFDFELLSGQQVCTLMNPTVESNAGEFWQRFGGLLMACITRREGSSAVWTKMVPTMDFVGSSMVELGVV